MKAQQEVFYTEKQNAVGVVYKNYPQRRSVRKTVPEPIFPRTEERLSSKEVTLFLEVVVGIVIGRLL